jgi:hypothetical protein
MEVGEFFSADAITRATRARLAKDHGVDSPYAVAKLPIMAIGGYSGPPNWQSVPDQGANPACRSALLNAVSVVANTHRLNLER